MVLVGAWWRGGLSLLFTMFLQGGSGFTPALTTNIHHHPTTSLAARWQHLPSSQVVVRQQQQQQQQWVPGHSVMSLVSRDGEPSPSKRRALLANLVGGLSWWGRQKSRNLIQRKAQGGSDAPAGDGKLE